MKIKVLLTFLVVFFTPIQAAMFGCGVLIVIDAITGIIASKVKGNKIESHKLKDTFIKMFLYQLGIITAHLTEVYIFEGIAFTKIILSSISVIEFYSVLENISGATGTDLLSSVKRKISDTLKPNK